MYFSFHNVANIFSGDRSGLQAGQFSTWTLLIRTNAVVIHAECSLTLSCCQEAKDFAGMCNRFEKKIHDLELTRIIALQMAPQIRLIQSNDIAISEKIQSTLVNTIPLWQSQMVIAIGLNHSLDAAKAQKEVTDMTNELLRKNAESLKAKRAMSLIFAQRKSFKMPLTI